MKLEALMLKSLFALCLLICLSTLGSMLILPSPAAHFAASHATIATTNDTAG